MPHNLKHHRLILVTLTVILSLLFCANLLSGEIKSWAILDWVDIAGEGGACLLVLIWLLMILNSRPSGMVSNLLAAGLTGILLASYQDALDEVISLPGSVVWDSWIESVCMPLGLLVLTLGLYYWHREQQLLTQQWRKRERVFRDHRQLDNLVSLSNASYLKDQLNYELSQGATLSLLMVDLDNFNDYCRQLGPQEADRLLHAVAELLLLNLRSQDLLCRYAGDRFGILLPNTTSKEATGLSLALQTALSHCIFRSLDDRPIQLTACISVVTSDSEQQPAGNAESLIEEANNRLRHIKQLRPRVA